MPLDSTKLLVDLRQEGSRALAGSKMEDFCFPLKKPKMPAGPWWQGGEATTRTMGGEERQATKVSGGNSALLVAFVGGVRFNEDDKRMKKKIR